MSVLLPGYVQARIERDKALEFTQDHRIQEFNGWLKNIDPWLRLVFAGPAAHGPGIQPGRWHVRRQLPGCAPTHLVISTNGVGVPGGFREPDSGVLESLRRADMWHRNLLAEEEAQRRSQERAEENYRESRREELALNIKAKLNPGVRFNKVLS